MSGLLMPKRIQMHRRPGGWRKDNPDAVIVARPTRWGNPTPWAPPLDRIYAARCYYNWITGCRLQRDLHGPPPTIEEIRRALAGRDLACWCPLCEPCHADILLRFANSEGAP